MTVTSQDLPAVLEAHRKWLRGEPDGKRANLSGANLSRAYLSDADLSGANLSGAYLSGAYLSRADLSGAYLSDANLSRADLSGANLSGANLSGAYLSRANLSGANLSGANLSDANLSRANLSGANLSGAYLSDANLSGANLSDAYLSDAKGLERERITPLMMLPYQTGPIRLFKVLNRDNEGHINGGITYEIGQTYEEADACTEIHRLCGPGLHVATLDWCLREWVDGYRIVIVEFTADDIACIPLGTDGKLRLKKLTVVGEIPAEEIQRMLGRQPKEQP